MTFHVVALGLLLPSIAVFQLPTPSESASSPGRCVDSVEGSETMAKHELSAQIDRAKKSGLKLDYVDYHMWTAISTPQLRAIVEKLAKQNQLGISRYFGEQYQSMFDVPVEKKSEEFFKRVNELPKNVVNLVVMHIAQDSPEMQALIDMNNPDQRSGTEPIVARHRSAELTERGL